MSERTNETLEAPPANCARVEVEQIIRVDPEAEGFKLDGVNIARVSRGQLLRFVRDRGIPFTGETKLSIWHAVRYHLGQIGWPADKDLRKVRIRKGDAHQ